MKKSIRYYKTKKSKKGTFGIALVERPAIKVKGIKYSENELNIDEVLEMAVRYNDEQMEMLAPILIPGQKIPHPDEEDGIYYLEWTEDVIKDFSDYWGAKKDKKFNIEHDRERIADVTMTQTYLLPTEMEMNGYNLPKGTWMGVIKFNDKSLWEDAKTGKINGFSIENDEMTAFLTEPTMTEFEKMNLSLRYRTDDISDENTITDTIKVYFENLKNNIYEMFTKKVKQQILPDGIYTDEMGVKFKIMDGVAVVLEAEVQEETLKLSDGTEVKVAGGVARIGEDFAPAGEHTLEDGKILVVGEEGKVVEIKEIEMSTTTPVEQAADEKMTEEQMKEKEKEMAEKMAAIEQSFSKKIEELEARLKEAEGKLTVTPAVPVETNPRDAYLKSIKQNELSIRERVNKNTPSGFNSIF